jgi:hypothetical protein
MMCPPILVYPYKLILSEIIQGVPEDRMAGHSPTGWMTAEVVTIYWKYFCCAAWKICQVP